MDVELPPGMPFPRVQAVEVVPPYGLRLTFADGTSGTIDGSRWLYREPPGVFAPLRDPTQFAKVRVRSDLGTIAWSDDLDLCPDVLYALAHSIPLPGID
jgi:hypothetical protein